MAIVVTPAATAIVVAKAAVMTVESVRVATPPRVPEFAWAPLRERPGLGLGHASRLQSDEPEARRNDKCRYCNASNVFHAQFVPSEVLNLRVSGHLISLCNARVMLIFTNRWSPRLLPGRRRNRWIGPQGARRRRQRAGVTDQRRTASVVRRGEQLRTAKEDHAWRARLSSWDTPNRQTAADHGSALRNLKSRCDFGAVRRVARIMSSGGRHRAIPFAAEGVDR